MQFAKYSRNLTAFVFVQQAVAQLSWYHQLNRHRYADDWSVVM
ncbi:hypothetical protein [Glaesserella parasuis]